MGLMIDQAPYAYPEQGQINSSACSGCKTQKNA